MSMSVRFRACLFIVLVLANLSPVLYWVPKAEAQATTTGSTQQAGSVSQVLIDSGSQVINSGVLNGTGSLSVAPGATAIIDFGANPVLNIAGPISNSGSIYAISSNPSVTTVTFNAVSVFNDRGAVLTTVLPTGVNINGVQNLNLSLSAINDIVNAGTISSAANLAISAGNSFTNSGVVTAARDINVLIGTAGLINSGVITSNVGNINISSLVNQNLIISNINGRLEALRGQINLSTPVALDTLNISVSGGDILSQELNVRSDCGIAGINVRELSGVINVDAGEVHVNADTQNLRLGSINLSGDPTFFNTTDIQITGNLSFPGSNLTIVSGGNITSSGGNWQISTSSPNFNAGNIILVAGVSFTPSGPPAGTGNTVNQGTPPAPGPPFTLTLNGPSASGGSIDLTGGGTANITSLDASCTDTAAFSGGSVTLIAYAVNAGTGNITLPQNVTINTSTAATTNNASTNGNVTVIGNSTGSNAISLGGINTSGITNLGVSYSGLVTIYSAAPQMVQAPNLQNGLAGTSLVGQFYPGQTFITVNDATNLSPSQVLTINPNGANPEQVTIGTGYGGGTTVPLQNPIQLYHAASEQITVPASNLTLQTNFAGPIINNGGNFAPGAIEKGNISVGQITAAGNVVIATKQIAAANAGIVNLTGNITLTQNPTPAASYNNTPVVQVTGQQINIASGATISSGIADCSICQDALNLITPNLSNAGTISSTSLNIMNGAGTGDLTVFNTGSIEGINNNPLVNIASTRNLNLIGTGSISVPDAGVISLWAADTNSINFNSSHTLAGGPNGLVLLDAQGAGGTINLGSGYTLNISGGSLVSINTPNLNLASLSSISASGPSNFIIGSGALTQSPQPLTITVANGSSAQIQTNAASAITLRPTDGQNIVFATTAGGSPTTLTFSGATVRLFTGTQRITNTTGSFSIAPNLTVYAPSSISAVNPNGGITGIAFEPLVGPVIAFPAYTLGSAYTYAQVLLLMAPIAQTGLFQSLGTYNQGSALINAAPPTQMSSYVINGADRFVIQAAKQIGFQVTAGASVLDPSHIVVVAGTNVESDYALSQAVKYGNVMDMVIGNECIIADGSGNIQGSIQNLITSINYAQNQRQANSPFNATTLPITTRQTYGGLSGVNDPQFDLITQTKNLLNGCASCYGLPTNYTGVDGHVYADVYPYYDQPVINYLGTNPGISQADFTTLVTNNTTLSTGIQPDLNGTITAFQAQSILPQLWVAETGWATTSTAPPANNAPQANVTWASWDYPAMQSWSSTSQATSGTTYQIPITGYFEAFDEPVKYSPSAGQGGEPNFGIWTANGTTSTAPNQQYVLNSITQKYALPVFNVSGTAPLTPSPQSPQLPSAPALTPRLSISLISDAFTLALNNANSSRILTDSTIVPTDLNPEIKSGDAATADNQSVALPTPVAPQLAGNLQFVNPQTGLSPLESHITLTDGNMLLAPDHDLSVDTTYGHVEITAGSAVLLVQNQNALGVFVLHDDQASAVQLTTNEKTIAVPVGRSLVLSRNQEVDFNNFNHKAIGRRNISTGKVGGLTATYSEFSLFGALMETQLIRNLANSSNKTEHALARKLLKTTAAIILLSKNSSPFRNN